MAPPGALTRREDAGLLRRLYDWTMTQAAGPHATRALAVVAFLESSIFPIPPDAMLVPMVLAQPQRAWRLAADRHRGLDRGRPRRLRHRLLPVRDAWASWIIEVYGLGARFADFQRTWNEWGLWIILIKGLTPIPYKLVTIASGLAKFNLGVFIAGLDRHARGLRFFLVAGLLRQFGTPIRTFIEQRLTLVTTGFAALIVLGFVVLRYL